MSNLTIKDIARICDVGISTVSRAINDDPGIKAETKERILKVIEEYKYVPNNSARNLKMNESNTIALLIKGIDNQFFQGMLKMFETELKKHKYTFLIQTVGEDQDDADVAIELAKEKRLKGIIFLGGLMDYPEEKLENMGIPYVLCSVALNLDAPERNCPFISLDDEKESFKIVDYLCKKGHKKILMIAGTEADYAVGRRRQEGYMAALEANGIEFDERLVMFMKDYIPAYTPENGYAVMKDAMAWTEEWGIDFTAVYAVSDMTAFGAYKAIYDAGKKIPEDYSVVGFDGVDIGEYFVPSLTTMKQPCEAMVKSTIELLLDSMNGKEVNKHLYFEAELVERDSVKDIN